ncbi:hypothetical protein J1N51_03120 [Psychrosphaera ytuae]|uniref:Cadherin domain-containing protein n=1 Tax=Psychrosphaera ytuae TaxID=2820710 RepID=A0A975HKM9_9GAMM|nr:hypothetical protein [Psychrosphaera ytuae]QTH64484.1 hypothetical protein J1N51_03120 [Psychrosphaera ytuae]
MVVLWALTGCGSSDGQDEPTPTDTPFSVQVSPTSLDVQVGEQVTLNYTLTNANVDDVDVSAIVQSDLGTAVINTDAQTVTFTAGDAASSGQLQLTFVAPQRTVVSNISITINDSANGGDGNGGGDGSGGDEEETGPLTVSWPSDYITIFEDEKITLNLSRNYSLDNSDITETLYLNAANLTGRLGNDGQSYTITADDGEEDTYGQLLAVTEYMGERIESSIDIIYYNKNRNLVTPEPPVIALIAPQMTLTPGVTTHLTFDVYDPDSDRISYRVVSAPPQVQTHVHRLAIGYQLSVSLIDSLPENQTFITLEVSDGHLKDLIDIELIESANSQSLVNNNQPPRLYLEENVTVSLTKRLTGNETDEISRFAFVMEDETPEDVTYDVLTTFDGFTFDINYPYFSVYADDVSQLQHEQITIVAADQSFQSKLTFHLYVRNNFSTFQGGNENLAPIIEATTPPPVLESKAIDFVVTGSDFEGHDYTLSAQIDPVYGDTTVNTDTVTVNTNLLAESTTVVTDVTVTATDVFGSDRSITVPIEIYKNSAPTITTNVSAIDIVETGTLNIPLNVADVDEGVLIPTFTFDSDLVNISYTDGIMTVTAQDVEFETSDSVLIRAEDEFGAVAELELPVIVRINNRPPEISVSQSQVTLAPGQSTTLLLTYTDPDGTALTINRFTNNTLLTFGYNQTSGELTLTLDPSAEFQQSMTFTTTASDGFIEVSETITVVVPTAPEPPILTIEPFNPNIEEGNFQIINYTVSDPNGDGIIISTLDGGTSNIANLQIDYLANSLQIRVPDNVLSQTVYRIQVVATDTSTSQLSTSEIIEVVALPENDPPTISLGAPSLALVNDYTATMTLNISDIDNQLGDLQIEALNGNSEALPTTIEVVGFDIYSITLKAATKGTSLAGEVVTIRVTDPDQTSATASFTLSKTIDNTPPYIEFENLSPKTISMGDNSSLTEVFYFFDDDVLQDGVTPEDTVVPISVSTTNNFGNASVVNITNINYFNNRVEFTINTNDVTLADPADSRPVSIAIRLTDGYVQVDEFITVKVRDDDL